MESFMMNSKICLHCFVSGRVQGVWFRAKTKEEASRLQFVGWVRNLADGRVEVLACGEKGQVMQLYEWLKQGPALASVDEVIYEEKPWQDFPGFEIL
jgi:acylphosphatase